MTIAMTRALLHSGESADETRGLIKAAASPCSIEREYAWHWLCQGDNNAFVRSGSAAAVNSLRCEFKPLEKGSVLEFLMLPDGNVRSFTGVGGYPMFYLCGDGGVLCAKCVTEEFEQCLDPESGGWYVVAAAANWEDSSLHCDHCSERIESAYAEEEAAAELDEIERI